MNLEEKLASAAIEMGSMADSLAEILQQLRGRISPALIDDTWWKLVLRCARELPAAIAAFPFGFEIPLHEPEAKADFGVSVLGRTEPAAFYKQLGQSADAGSPAAALAWLVREMESDDAAIHEIVSRKMMLEYDIASALRGTQPEPGIFIRPSARPLVGGDERDEDINTVLDAIAAGAGWQVESGERRHTVQVYRALKDDSTWLESFGAFPSRERAIRLAVGGFRTLSDIQEFLERSGWSGQTASMAEAVEPFQKKNAFACVTAHLDVTADGLGPTLGLSFMPKVRVESDPNYWIDDPRMWVPFLDCLRQIDFLVPSKLSALDDWSAGAEILHYRSSSLVLMWLIHHVKMVIDQDKVEKIKAYPFFLMHPMGKGEIPSD